MPRLLAPALAALLALAPLRLRAANPVIELWPEGVPGFKANGGAEQRLPKGEVANVQRPSLTVFRAGGKPNGTAVIVCPGGGYTHLAFDLEGTSPARWLNGLGVSAFVLKYRLAEYGAPAPLQDVLRAIRLVRSRAAEFGVRPDRIGVLGFSAGGHLAACAGTLYADAAGMTGAPIDAYSARPDFMMLGYPVISMEIPYVHAGSRNALLGRSPSESELERWSPDLHVDERTPPAFLVAAEDDRTVSPMNSLLFYQALLRAHVPAELHLFEHGGHGFGLKPGFGPTSHWPQRAEEWMRSHGWLR